MGQQQLILLVLATVIVGIAIVVGIRAFTENSAKANSDAMMQDGVRIASDLQTWKKKPRPFGGQAAAPSVTTAQVQAAEDYSGATWALLGYTDGDGDPDVYTNLNGTFDLDPQSTATTITGTNLIEGNEVIVVVDGITDADIEGTVTCLGGFDPAGAPCTLGTTN